jgi:hypothetical protein
VKSDSIASYLLFIGTESFASSMDFLADLIDLVSEGIRRKIAFMNDGRVQVDAHDGTAVRHACCQAEFSGIRIMNSASCYEKQKG